MKAIRIEANGNPAEIIKVADVPPIPLASRPWSW